MSELKTNPTKAENAKFLEDIEVLGIVKPIILEGGYKTYNQNSIMQWLLKQVIELQERIKKLEEVKR